MCFVYTYDTKNVAFYLDSAFDNKHYNNSKVSFNGFFFTIILLKVRFLVCPLVLCHHLGWGKHYLQMDTGPNKLCTKHEVNTRKQSTRFNNHRFPIFVVHSTSISGYTSHAHRVVVGRCAHDKSFKTFSCPDNTFKYEIRLCLIVLHVSKSRYMWKCLLTFVLII